VNHNHYDFSRNYVSTDPNPILIDENDVILAGHARWEAAKILGLTTVPVIVINGLSEPKKRALLLADNRIAQNAGWGWEAWLASLKTSRSFLHSKT
jgi:ParB-like chromosome segregation protein Spo0J